MTRYNGNNVFGVSFNLYGYEDIDFEETAIALVNMVDSMKDEINKKLNSIGLNMIDAFWFSPSRYNFSGDSVDPEIEITDLEKYVNYLEENRNEIQKWLNVNHSYDGFISMTVKDIDTEIERVKRGKAADVIPIGYALNGIIDQDDITDQYVFSEEEENYDFINSEEFNSCSD